MEVDVFTYPVRRAVETHPSDDLASRPFEKVEYRPICVYELEAEIVIIGEPKWAHYK